MAMYGLDFLHSHPLFPCYFPVIPCYFRQISRFCGHFLHILHFMPPVYRDFQGMPLWSAPWGAPSAETRRTAPPARPPAAATPSPPQGPSGISL